MKPKTIQKLMGVGLIACGVAASWLMDWDCTNLLLTVPMGLILIFSKENIIGLVDENGEEPKYIDKGDKQE